MTMNNSDKYLDLHKQSYGGHSLVKSNESDELFIMKKLEFFEIKVFEYLKENHNIHIPRVYEFWEEDGMLTVVEEYIAGKTLEQYIKENTLTRDEKRKLITDILDGLEFLHGAAVPIIHRDLKDTNIMITNDGVLKIIDYDAAKTFKVGETKDTLLVGTAGSAAPEQYGFAQSDPRTDIYAVGMLMRQLFEGDSHYESIMIKATRMDPKQRYQNVREFKKAFRFDVGRDFDIVRKPLIITAGVLAGSIFVLWGVWFIKFSKTVDEEGNVIYVNPVKQVLEDLNVKVEDDSPQWIEYDGQTYPYSDELLESLSNAVETSESTGEGLTAVIGSSGEGGRIVISGTATPTSTPGPTPTPYVKTYDYELEQLNKRLYVYMYSREQMINLLMEEENVSRSVAETAVDRQNYDWSDRAVYSAASRNTGELAGPSCDNGLSPKDMRPYLLSLGFTSSQIRNACDITYYMNDNRDYWASALGKYMKSSLSGHRYTTLSSYFGYLHNEGFTQAYIDKFLSIATYLRSVLYSEIQNGYMTDDLGYFDNPITTPTPTPYPTATASPTPTPVPDTEPTVISEETTTASEENTDAVD